MDDIWSRLLEETRQRAIEEAIEKLLDQLQVTVSLSDGRVLMVDLAGADRIIGGGARPVLQVSDPNKIRWS